MTGWAGRVGGRRGLKILLDGRVEPSIEWQASLIESQLEIAALQARRIRVDEPVGENEAKSECLTRF